MNGLPEKELVNQVKNITKSMQGDTVSKGSQKNKIMPEKMDMQAKLAMMAQMGHKEKMAMVGQMYAKMMTSYDGFSTYASNALVTAFDLSPYRNAIDLGGKLIIIFLCNSSFWF